jgi:hypothetical protein
MRYIKASLGVIRVFLKLKHFLLDLQTKNEFLMRIDGDVTQSDNLIKQGSEFTSHDIITYLSLRILYLFLLISIDNLWCKDPYLNSVKICFEVVRKYFINSEIILR